MLMLYPGSWKWLKTPIIRCTQFQVQPPKTTHFGLSGYCHKIVQFQKASKLILKRPYDSCRPYIGIR